MKYLVYLLILLSVAYGAWNIKGCTTPKPKEPTVQYINPLADTVRHYKDIYGKEHAQVLIEQNTKQAIMTMHKQQIDSLLRTIKAKSKQLENYEKIAANAQGSFKTVLVPVHDTIQGEHEQGAREWEWHDDYMQMWGVVDSNDISVNYDMSLNIRTAITWHRKHKLLGIGWGKKVRTLNAVCNNPNVHINGLQGLKID